MWRVRRGACVLCEQKNATVWVGEDSPSESKEAEHQTGSDKDPNNHKREPANNAGAAKGDLGKGDATSVGADADGGVAKAKRAPLQVNPAAAAAAQVSGAVLEKKEGNESGGHKQADLEPGTSQQTHLSSIYPSSVSVSLSLARVHTHTMVWRHK
jgi:hypothetical protein